MRGSWINKTVVEFNDKVEFTISVSIGLIAGLLGGSILILIYEKIFKNKSFGFSWLVTALFFVALFIITFLFVNIIVFNAQYAQSENFEEAIASTLDATVAPPLITTFALWGFIVVLTVFSLQINDKFGPGILRKFIRGDYHQPKLEDRLFMFLDMRSSTVIAEKLGNTAYFNLLQEVFLDLTDPIIAHHGEIYQYVGDEAVLTWRLDIGIQNENFLNAFFNFKNLTLKTTHEQTPSDQNPFYNHTHLFPPSLLDPTPA